MDKVATTLFTHPVLLTLAGGISFSYPFAARLTGPGGAPISGQVIRFGIGDRQVCTAITTSTGWASCGTLTDFLHHGSTDHAGLVD